jgi:hypothetical protein
MTKSEVIKMSCKVVLDERSVRDALIVKPELNGRVELGDKLTVDYTFTAVYIGDLADKLEAMIRLGGRPSTSDRKMMQSLLKRLFLAFEDS